MASIKFYYNAPNLANTCEADIVNFNFGGDLLQILRFKVNMGRAFVADSDSLDIYIGGDSSIIIPFQLSHAFGYIGNNGQGDYNISHVINNITVIQRNLNNSASITIGGFSIPSATVGAQRCRPLCIFFNEYDQKYLYATVLNTYIESTLSTQANFTSFYKTTNSVSADVIGFVGGLLGGGISATNYDALNAVFSGSVTPLPTDPYSGAGDSTTGGGDGTFDGSSDPVPVPNLPSVGAQDSGFITLFTPTASQMKDLAHYMWVNPLFDIETGFKKLFSDPMDCILGLSVVPVTIPTSGAKNVNIGNLVTSVTMNVASQQYIEVNCGTVTMDRFFGSYLDFEPYTKIAIFLPYCGTHALSMDDIAGKTIGVVYHIDILTGSCIAFVKCGDSVLYEFNGACGSNIPVNSLNFASTIENAIRIAVNIGTTVATAGASAPATTATELARQKAMNTARNISLAGSTAEGALSLKPSVSRSGALGGGVGILGHQIPYFIITRPRLCKPAKQDFFQGYPSFIQTTIGDLIGKGFTSFTNVIISGQYLTDEEETELENILESGVYL